MEDNIYLKSKRARLRTNLGYFGKFGTALYLILLVILMTGCVKEAWVDKSAGDPIAIAAIAETFPANLGSSVVINTEVAVTFKSTATASEVSTSTITLLDGKTPVQGTVSIIGNTVIFTPSADLKPDTKFTATIKFTLNNGTGDYSTDLSWTFNTGTERKTNALSVVSVTPSVDTTSVAVDVAPTATFSQEMNAELIKTTSFTLTHGTTAIAGTVSYSGNKATFTPALSLGLNLVYTGTITTESKNVAGNPVTATYTWNFTTEATPKDVTPPTVLTVIPANSATSVGVNSNSVITFSEAMTATTITSATVTLKQGTTAVAGTVTYTGNTATFTPTSALTGGTVYTGTVTTGAKDIAGNALAANYTWTFTTAPVVVADVTPPTVLSAIPANNATLVAVNGTTAVTFSETMTASTISTSTFTLKQGTTAVAGTVSYSGTTATFTPTGDLSGGKVYTGTITTGAKDAAGNAIAANYTWSFTTATVVVADVTPPTVLSVTPANNATSIAVDAAATVTFSEAMTASTITSSTVTLKQGTTAVAGTVSYSGNTATFTPSGALSGSTVYTGTVTTGAKDAEGNAIAANYTWSFTTAAVVVADVTPPTVLSVVPASGATSIALNSNLTATFSEAMTASTITSSTFTLSQGSTSVAGTVNYSGTTATFTPTSALTAGLVYTATITTGAKDAAGNAIAAAKTWSFTTVAAVTVTSWSAKVWPIIQAKCTPCHGASGGSAGINMGSYAQVAAMSNSQIDNSGMYSKMGVTAAEKAIIQAWIAEGKLNN